MDSDFMNHLANMLKNGNIPEEMKEKMNGFLKQNTRTKYEYWYKFQNEWVYKPNCTDKIPIRQMILHIMQHRLLIMVIHIQIWIQILATLIRLTQLLLKCYKILQKCLWTLRIIIPLITQAQRSPGQTGPSLDFNTLLKMKSIMEKMR